MHVSAYVIQIHILSVKTSNKYILDFYFPYKAIKLQVNKNVSKTNYKTKISHYHLQEKKNNNICLQGCYVQANFVSQNWFLNVLFSKVKTLNITVLNYKI